MNLVTITSSFALSQKCSGLGHSELPRHRRQRGEVESTLESQEN